MAKKTEERKVIKRDNWSSSFVLTGRAKINNFTFKIDEQSEKSKCDGVHTQLPMHKKDSTVS